MKLLEWHHINELQTVDYKYHEDSDTKTLLMIRWNNDRPAVASIGQAAAQVVDVRSSNPTRYKYQQQILIYCSKYQMMLFRSVDVTNVDAELDINQMSCTSCDADTQVS